MPGPETLPDLVWASERCLRLPFGTDISEASHRGVRGAYERLRHAAVPGLVDLTPAYATLLLTFDLATLDIRSAEKAVRAALAAPGSPVATAPRLVEVPVCYAGECALDLAEVARLRGLAPEQVVALHSGAEYVVQFLGFSPGFPYLAGLPAALETPRLEQPRVRVPAGSVAIAARQAGLYPQATPGGWRILGRTPLVLFDAQRDPPALLRIGDRVRFVPISRAEFDAHAPANA